MPILLQSKKFTDEWGNETTFDRSNAGDKVKMTLTFISSIYISSNASPFIYDLTTNMITCGGGSFEAEGFRVGDLLKAVRVNADGSTATWFPTVVYVSGNVMKLSSIDYPADAALQQQMYFRVDTPVSGGFRNRASIECFLNYIDNTSPGNDYSLIDGEATRFKFSAIDEMSISDIQSAIIVGNQSGQYLKGVNLTRLSDLDVDYERRYALELNFVNSGIYEQEWFDSSECIKPYVKTLWSSIEDEPFQQTSLIYNDSANTGWYNEAHNSDPVNAELVQGVNEIDYANPTSFTLIVDGEITELGIGSSYVPLNTSYYKNKVQQQGIFGMIIPTSDLSITTYDSEQNLSGADYQIRIDDIQVLGSVTYIECVFLPGTNFASFMEAQEDGDRTFYLWVKCGNLNLLAFHDQLTTSPPVGGELIMVESKAFYDHSYNTTNGIGSTTYNRFDTEDDLAYFGTFLMDNSGNYSSFRVRIEAFNTDTEEDFTLKETTFSFASTQINSSGVYLIDETVTVNPNLPTTSAKRDSLLKREPSIDTLTQFGISIYYPFILDWRYWVQQLNASTDFYPTQDKNWKQYSGSGDWVVRMELELIKDGLAFTHSNEVTILGYNAKSQVITTLQYIRESDSSAVSALIQGEIMRIKSKHINVLGSWNPSTWGMLTVEPKEGQPRQISSTVINFDNNSNNPLYPIPGETKAKLTLVADIAYIECLCDTNKLIGMNQSFTAKIKDPDAPLPPNFKTTAPDDTNKTTSSDNTPKTIS